MVSYGPMSEGVTGSDGGGGRLMRVGVDILPPVICCSYCSMKTQVRETVSAGRGRQLKSDRNLGLGRPRAPDWECFSPLADGMEVLPI